MSLGFFANNMSFKAIIKATFWKNDDTFVNYYLRDIRVTCQYDTVGIDMVVDAG